MNHYQSIAKMVSKRYRHIPNLVGIIWIGSSSYGIIDKFTDIDIFLVVSKPNKKFVMQQFEENGIKVEVDMMDLSWLTAKVGPDNEQFWIREKVKIMYDPKKVLSKKFRQLNSSKLINYDSILWSLYKELFNSYDFKKSMKRNEKITACMYIFKTIDVLSRFIFIYHNRAVPTYKWRWYFISKEKLFDQKLIFKLLNISSSNLKPNLKILEKIESEVEKMMLKKGFPFKKVSKPWLY